MTKRFGRVVIAEDLSLAVGPGDMVGIVGPNGAGKTSLFGLISGDLAPGAGEVRFAGRAVTKLDPAARCKLGIGRTYQVPRPFGDMTVFENLLVAAQQGGGLRRRASYTAAVEALERTGMSGQANVPAERLGLLQRKRLELARALATQPTLLLLDEVAGGLTDPEVAQLVEIVRGVNADGIAVIWIEHVVRALTAVVQPADLPVRRQVRRRRRPGHGAGRPRGPRGLPRHPRSARRWPAGAGSIARRAGGRRGGRGTGASREPAVKGDGEVGGGTAGSRHAAAGGPGPDRAPRAAPGPGRDLAPGVPRRGLRDHRRERRGQVHAAAHDRRPAPPGGGLGPVRRHGLTRLRPERRARQGIVMVPEGRRLFGSLSVEENLKVGATYARKGPWTIERVYEMFSWMRERRNQRTAQLSGGEQQTVAIGRALVANPRVLLLDELSLGLAPVVVQRIYGMLPQILATGLTVLLVEQDVSQALRVASHIHCLLEGRTTLEGRPADVTAEQVEAAYFGLAGAAPASQPAEGSESLWPG